MINNLYIKATPTVAAVTWGSITGTLSAQTDLQSALDAKQATGNYITALTGEATATGPGSVNTTLSNSAVIGKVLTGLNLAGGGTIADTDSILLAFGKVQNQISGLLGGVTFQGVWNASTNTPTLTSSVGTKGYYYIVNVAGSTNLNGITDWKIGDWAVFNGTTWDKVDNTDAVSSVNGFTGAVSLTTADISEVTNLYYTEARVNANTNVAANTAARHNAVTIGTANGLSLSTQALSLALASTSVTGALSSTDWTTFNNKQNALGFTAVPTTRTISTTAPLSGGGDLSADRTLSIPAATTLVDGYISATDWTTFNGKQAALVSGTNIKTINSTTLLGSGNIAVEPTITAGTTGQYYRGDKTFQTLDKTAVGLANVDNTSDANKPISTATQTALNAKQGTITLTTTGTSGASTLVGNTLNIPQYSGGSGVTSVTGTAPVVSSGGTTPAISMAAATTSVDGYLTSTNFNTFNDKQAALVSGTNIKTVNSTTLLGSGDLAVQPTLVSGTNIKTINSTSLLGSGDIAIAALPFWLESNVTGRLIWNNGSGNIVSNTSFGDGALKLNTTGTFNTAIGQNTLDANTTGSGNIGVGPNALGANTTGGGNVAVGQNALAANTTGGSNIAIGGSALASNTASNNTAVGATALWFNTTGYSNTAIGKSSLSMNTTGLLNTAAGESALAALTTASFSVAVGASVLRLCTTNGANTGVGALALENTTAAYNTAVGSYALNQNTTGQSNVSIGSNSLQTNVTGSYNVAIGANTGTTGSDNIIIGFQANAGSFSGSVILGRDASATASNQFVVGSLANNAGAVNNETLVTTKTWSVIINGVARKILLA